MRTTPATTVVEMKRPRGRVRSDTSRIAILDATLKLLKTNSVQSITIEAIAKEAEVSKATIYRWWKSKASVVIDAFVQNHLGHTPMPRGQGARKALEMHLHSLIEQYSGWPGRLVAQILAEGQSDPEVLREFRERFWYGRRAMVREVIEQGRTNGEFREDIDPEFEMDMLYSPIYQRLLMGHAPLDRKFATQLTQQMLGLLDARPAAAVASGRPPLPPAATRVSKPKPKAKAA